MRFFYLHTFFEGEYYIIYRLTERIDVMLVLGCKAVGLAALTFCVGMLAGIVLPLCAVAVLEAVLIVVMGYCCLFKW